MRRKFIKIIDDGFEVINYKNIGDTIFGIVLCLLLLPLTFPAFIIGLYKK